MPPPLSQPLPGQWRVCGRGGREVRCTSHSQVREGPQNGRGCPEQPPPQHLPSQQTPGWHESCCPAQGWQAGPWGLRELRVRTVPPQTGFLESRKKPEPTASGPGCPRVPPCPPLSGHKGSPAGHTWKSSRELGRSSRLRMSRGARHSGKSTTGRREGTSSGRTRL